MTQSAITPDRAGQGRTLAVVVVGLAAVVVAMLCAFALPSIHSGPHDIPVGATGPQAATAAVGKALAGEEWDVTTYDDEKALKTAIEDRDVMGGIVLAQGRITVYTATAAGAQSAASLTGVVTALAKQQQAEVTVTDLKPFPADDPKGAGFSSAALPMIFGGMIPAVILSRLFPGHAGLRLRLAGGVAFAVVAGFAVTAMLQYGTGSLSGTYWLTSLGLSLGMAALALTLLGLESLRGMAGFGLGAAVIMLLGNPLSGLAGGPHWLPDGWATLGQFLPPGASGSLLRANAFFDGTGAGSPALTLGCWVLLGLALILIADRRGLRRGTTDQPAPEAQLV
ncbi:hypothetical protein JIX56_21935 [Streptomyces sp. CA-210063]|uniref:hypothetical protein n=1 Tax=Streptomyces sp. CA-210063 TaxID=2801029 RepID=UPI00214CE20B|nr:hypothetical protein [Streptomyces sp. CA-210063]UUU32346.1 hypothetical protein JIX56_21935 [Streptomyces sp. CA-210063]